nr:unnamed protein product [Digitaria exilis]
MFSSATPRPRFRLRLLHRPRLQVQFMRALDLESVPAAVRRGAAAERNSCMDSPFASRAWAPGGVAVMEMELGSANRVDKRDGAGNCAARLYPRILPPATPTVSPPS